jgi:hypothetical protein
MSVRESDAKTIRDLLSLAGNAGSSESEAETALRQALAIMRRREVKIADLFPVPVIQGISRETHDRCLHEAYNRGVQIGYQKGLARAVEEAERKRAVISGHNTYGVRLARAVEEAERLAQVLDVADDLLEREPPGWARARR